MPVYRRRLVVLGLLLILVLFGVWQWRARPTTRPQGPPVSPPPQAALRGTPISDRSGVTVVATGLEVPWALAVASPRVESRGPDLYVTERPGRLVLIREGVQEVIAIIPGVSQRAESGLLGLALDPQFAHNHLLYLYFTTTTGVNRVVRYRLDASGLADAHVLLDGIPSAPFHDGGRIAFGPDGNLYITTGDANQPAFAQDSTSLAGKILRIQPDGSPPSDNPFPNSPVYSLGHRNPQGLAWAADGTLYATEHGPSGVGADCCHDEVNSIESGQNYGWPAFAGATPRPKKNGAVGNSRFPISESGPTETWAPAGTAIIGHTLFFGGLRGEALFTLDLVKPGNVTPHLRGQFGRIRDVVSGPDGFLYLTTSNRDGRGTPRRGDDSILRIDPAVLIQ